MNDLRNKHITCFLKVPSGFRYSGTVTEESEGFIVLYNSVLNRTNYVSKDNILSMEVDE